ncbi:hypothetical protein BKA93DRAFT_737719 [Sparassis latifolia]|uniref:BTB domain-containing protein n=1 Tax=Sparassis crispa TaxID=139825 RepID=A0A401GSH8_9APHY|nr:hypothetical protein SCP_0703770 [Sparassis crispa]GBE85191.1 hypothetical protein SCP_0703770 [Sparassis crispa]
MSVDSLDLDTDISRSSSAGRYRSPSPGSPSRKRARLEDEDSEVIQELQPRVPYEGEVVQDDMFYLSDGSCILRVENTLFNVHRTILTRDCSSFSAMFDMPVPQDGRSETEGSSDYNPIILTGDTVAEFKNFLWALYALPNELMTVFSPSADLNQMMDIAHVANKYSFRSVETWALDALNEYVNRKPTPIFCYPPFVSAKDVAASGVRIARLVRLAQTCSHTRLLTALVVLLKQRMNVQIQYAFLAMTLADDLGLRALRGVAYMEVLQHGMKMVMDGPRQAPAPDKAQEGTDGDELLVVSPNQRLRLLSGFHRLAQTWETFRLQPLQFEHAPTCGATWHQHGCTQSWLEFWKEKSKSDSVLALGLADVQGRMRAMVKEFERWGSATYMHHDCRMTAKKVMQEKIKALEEALPDFFVD